MHDGLGRSLQSLRESLRAVDESETQEIADAAPAESRQRLSKVALVVLGMHRSGTSAFTRVFSLMGCDLPKTLMGAGRGNDMGHWESQALVDFNDALLESTGSSWHDWLAFNSDWYGSPKAEEFKERALALLREEFGASRLFVLKDPRICRLLPFWLDVLNTAGVRPAIVMPVRNPLEVVASLERRDGVDPALGHLLWLRHVLEAEAASRGLKRFHCSYDALMACWPRLVSRTQETLDITFPRLPEQMKDEVGAFLIEQPRHHRETPKNVIENPLLSVWLRDAFEIFHRWAEEGESAADFAAFDRIRAAFDAAAHTFARLVISGERATRKVHDLERQLNERFGEIATLTRFLRETENTARRAVDEADWMRQVASVLLGGGSWRGKLVWLLPGPVAHALQKIQLKRRRLFDAKAYLRAHPDVARSGADPLRHYINFGIKGGRRRG